MVLLDEIIDYWDESITFSNPCPQCKREVDWTEYRLVNRVWYSIKGHRCQAT